MSHPITTEPRPDFYTAGGTLGPSAPSYIPRAADRELLDAVKQGKFCYVLTPRQMGKSSLMVRTARELKTARIKSVIIDLSRFGATGLGPEAWYLGQIEKIVSQLKLDFDYEEYWGVFGHLGVVQRFTNFLTEVVLTRVAEPVVVFVDEIDTTLSLGFNSDDYFAAIRALYNERAINPALERLTFVLLGVASPSDLIKDWRRTPFNIGKRVHLTDFREEESRPLIAGLAPDSSAAVQLLDRVLFWTGGHPYLTQKTCARVAEWSQDHWSPTDVPIIVDDLVQEMFLSDVGQKADDNLKLVRKRVLESHESEQLVGVYRRIRHGEVISDNELDLILSTLKLSGLIKSVDGVLRVRNSIYERVFDESWIRTALSERKPHPVRTRDWTNDVFISYSSRDLDFVKKYLLPRLEVAGLRTMVDFRDFRLGEPILQSMERAIAICRYTLVVLTPDWVASQWTEVESLLVGTGREAGVRLIPLLLRPTEIPYRLRMLQYVDLTEQKGWERGMQSLLKNLGAEESKISHEVVLPPPPPTLDYDTGEIRKLLTEYFDNDDALNEFAYDYFRQLYERFTPEMPKALKVQALIEYAEKNDLFEELLDQIARFNPRLYRRYSGRVKSGKSSGSSPPSA